jgi:hypothetical protein
MADPIAYRRIRSIIKVYGRFPSQGVADIDDAVHAIKRDRDAKPDFTVIDRQSQKSHLISDPAILRWINAAHYWGLVAKDRLLLTDQGIRISRGSFVTQFQGHLAEFVRETWEVEIDDVIDSLSSLDGRNHDNWPNMSSWNARYEKIPQGRFRQLAYFLVGLNLVRRIPLIIYVPMRRA